MWPKAPIALWTAGFALLCFLVPDREGSHVLGDSDSCSFRPAASKNTHREEWGMWNGTLLLSQGAQWCPLVSSPGRPLVPELTSDYTSSSLCPLFGEQP